MITTIHIKNIGIIGDLSINLNAGLNILTGETGAGKTLIIDSLAILCGSRFSKEMIRKGEEYSYVEACIYMPENKNAIDGNIIVSREIYTNGRNSCKINGRLVTVNELRDFMKHIIDIHGQNDNQILLEKASHITYLDRFIGSPIKELKKEYIQYYEKNKEIDELLKINFGDEKEKERKLALLQYQYHEIEQANIKIGEEQILEEKRKRILNSEKIAENLQLADETLNENGIDSVSTAIRALEKIEDIDKNYKEKLLELKNVYYEIQEIARDINSLRDTTYFEEEERRQIEERLDTIFSLKRKYGNTEEEILKYQKEIEEEINRIENVEEVNKKRLEEQKQIREEMKKIAEKLTKLRMESAQKLAKEINNELMDLEMKQAKCSVKVKQKQEFDRNGLDDVEFLICTNIGEDEKPLIKIASGGEMSRIMLAIKSVLNEVDEVAILIFDEIDTGISGQVAKAVGNKMKQIAKNHQILCITHLASIAAKGDYNYYISKIVENGNTKTQVKLLKEEEAIEEIARIASGEVTKAAIAHAKELRNDSRKERKVS